ncbi:MAG: hypothetical protein MJ237_01925 [bacterium]|nr:hypothetical protein [bacterium]
MKKFFVFCLLCFPMAVFAQDCFIGVKAPQWQDFVPKAFVDVKEPKGLGKLNVTAKYWYDRKIEFNSALEDCNLKTDIQEKLSCYEVLKLNQYKQNGEYNAKLEAKMNPQTSVPGMENPTDTMIPIGGYLEQMTRYIPNEFR